MCVCLKSSNIERNAHLINHQNNLYTFWCVLCYYRVIITAYTDLNITEFLLKILLFPEDCASSSLSQDLSDKL